MRLMIRHKGCLGYPAPIDLGGFANTQLRQSFGQSTPPWPLLIHSMQEAAGRERGRSRTFDPPLWKFQDSSLVNQVSIGRGGMYPRRNDERRSPQSC